ncbi:uncharacterized protein [Amphiura filiformis]|uniref:uncharacterized protein n=1 Tax=Amphiura filiformis TaxID=82378 RepID=UPI003B212B21
MSSITKEFDTRAKKTRPKLSLKLPSLRSRSSSSPLRSNLRRIKEENDKGKASSSEESSDDSYDSEEEMKKYQRGGRRRSLSTSNIDDIRSDESGDENTERKQRGHSLSSSGTNKTRPDSPTVPPLLSPRSCLRRSQSARRRSTSMSDVEEILNQVQAMHVHFSPDTVDLPERDCKYREYCERKLGLKGFAKPNLKHEMHKQHMKQMKKVNLSDYMSSPNKGYNSGPVFSPMAGGGAMMMM